MAKMTIVIPVDIVKECRRASRAIFGQLPATRVVPDKKTKYTRKRKHKKEEDC